MIEKTYVVRCDDCGAVYDWRQFQSKEDALQVVTSDGWTVKSKRLRCVPCSA